MTLLEACKAYVESPDSQEAKAAVVKAVMELSTIDAAWDAVNTTFSITSAVFNESDWQDLK